MKKFLAIGAALAALTLPALADVQVRDILINQAAPKAEATNIRVDLANTGASPARISSVSLQVRDNASDSWQTIKTFNNANYLKIMPHKHLALDYLPARGEAVNPIILQPQFQVRAVVNAHGNVLASAERPYVANYESFVMPR
ncbi:hypothetical protein JST97_35745 [bacterium]|nr:hypothetical protein [bacterium]